ncbi:hypothetical protein BELL_0004g00380 [Botrytis elliptica]|uniref:Uncharacterized protein n=1 Tax=Botrytis elliptica TaxID=278938 RepID=A0A4Z1K3C7_9HELO|nr:hypothetical protein BELL_0004g00380 [Botrytis elliptica]
MLYPRKSELPTFLRLCGQDPRFRTLESLNLLFLGGEGRKNGKVIRSINIPFLDGDLMFTVHPSTGSMKMD